MILLRKNIEKIDFRDKGIILRESTSNFILCYETMYKS